MGCCRVCRGALAQGPGRERCQNPHCWTNQFTEGSLVRCSRDLGLGTGKVVEVNADGSKALVSYWNGTNAWESRLDLFHHELQPGTRVLLASGPATILSSEAGRAADGFDYRVSAGGADASASERGILGLSGESPAELAAAGIFESPSRLSLGLRALHFREALAGDGMMCIHTSRVELMGHQVAIAHRAVQEHNPRYLLADEVGLGKTMEAGLILKEMKARGLADRVLVVAPSTLVPQWVSEMGSKFNEDFEVHDSAKVRELRSARPGDNPWSAGGNVITSLQYARKDGVRGEVADAHWDIVIFDEAHHLRRKLDGREVRMTKAFRLAEKLRDRCGAMLLLTATPLQLQSYEFYSLLELIDPGRFPDYNHFEAYRQKAMGCLNAAIRLLAGIGERTPTQEKRGAFGDLAGTLEWLRASMPRAHPQPGPPLAGWQGSILDAVWRRDLLRELLEYQVAGGRMMRNRKSDVFPGGPRRKAATIRLALTAEERRAYDLVSAYVRRGYSKAVQDGNSALGFVMTVFQKLVTSSRAALISAFENRIRRLREAPEEHADGLEDDIEDFDMLEEAQQDELMARLYSIRSFDDEAAVLAELCEVLRGFGEDTKARALADSLDAILGADPSEKVLVFTQFHATQEFLRSELSARYRVAVFNGRMSREEKEAAIRAFRDSAQVMISTEAGGEGRNFQFAHIMFNYDLPWNPMRVEQRIGRLDRIGQTRVVNIYNFSYGDTVEQRILDALYDRIGLFEETIGAVEPILGDIEAEIAGLLMRDVRDLDREIERYELSLSDRIADAREIERRLEDFTMDTRLFQMEPLDALLGRKPAVTSDQLRRFVVELVTKRGGFVTDAYGDVTTIRVPADFPLARTSARTLSGTFDIGYARRNEQVDFLAFGHQFIEDCLDAAAGEPLSPMVACVQGSGVLFVYLAEFSDIRSTRRLVPVYIGDGMAHSPEESRRKLGALLAGKMGECAGSQSGADISRHLEAAEAAALVIIRAMAQEMRSGNAELVKREVARLDRLHAFKERKLADQMDRDTARLAKMLASGDERHRKVAPAIQGRIDKARRELDGLDGEIAAKKAELLKRLDFGERHWVVAAAIGCATGPETQAGQTIDRT